MAKATKKATEPVATETEQPKTLEEQIEAVVKQNEELNKRIASLEKENKDLAKTNKRDAFVAKRDGWRQFGVVTLNEDGSYTRKGMFEGKGGKKATAMGALKAAAIKASHDFETYVMDGNDYAYDENGLYMLENDTYTFLMNEKYTDKAYEVTVKAEIVPANTGIKRFATSVHGIAKSKVVAISKEPITLDLSKEIRE